MFKDFSATLIRKTNLAPNIWETTFQISNDTMQFDAGQYVLLKIDDQVRQYSMSSPGGNVNEFQLITEHIEGGLASTYIQNLHIGDRVDFRGPAGIFTLKDNDLDKVFLATGTGIAPIISMIDTYFNRGGDKGVELFFGVKTRADLYLYEHFIELSEKYDSFNFSICLSREQSIDDLDDKHMAKGHIQDVYVEKDIHNKEFYICGSKKTVESLKTFVKDLGVGQEYIHFENFG